MRKILKNPVERVTQGTVFNNAMSNHYDIANGVFVTARCDIENDHLESINYIPIIELKYWLRKDFLSLLFKRIIKNTEKKIESEFKKKDLSVSALNYIDNEKVINAHFTKNEARTLLPLIRTKHIYEYTKESNICEDDYQFLIDSNRKELENISKDLIENKLNGYFYVENYDFVEQECKKQNHSVLLLQEIHSIPTIIAKKLLLGIDVTINNGMLQFFKRPIDTLAIAEINSPYIECIIQNCLSQFRFGVDRAEYLDVSIATERINEA